MGKIVFWSIIISFILVIGEIIKQATLKALGKEKPKIKDKYVFPIFIGMNILIITLSIVIPQLFSFNEKVSVIALIGMFALCGIANIEFWSRVE